MGYLAPPLVGDVMDMVSFTAFMGVVRARGYPDPVRCLSPIFTLQRLTRIIRKTATFRFTTDTIDAWRNVATATKRDSDLATVDSRDF